MSMILYQYAGGDGLLSLSPPSMKVQLALKRLDLPHQVVDVQTPSGPFLDGRDQPGRGDLAVASFLVQIGWKEIDRVQSTRFKQRGDLVSYTLRTLEACDAKSPAWLRQIAGAEPPPSS